MTPDTFATTPRAQYTGDMLIYCNKCKGWSWIHHRFFKCITNGWGIGRKGKRNERILHRN